MRFSPELIEALEKLGFGVAENGEYAEHYPLVSIEQHAADDVRMIVQGANGEEFVFRLKPQQIINKVNP
jgi:hypothetical protein